MTTERPILFSTAMVRELLGGTKTQTRRPVVPMAGMQSRWLTHEMITASPRLRVARSDEGDANRGELGAAMEHPKGGPLGWVRCPYGQPGDVLWVRETFSACRHGKAHPKCLEYRADAENDEVTWTPSIHMPRKLARIFLRITQIRVERLRDISDDDARAEGVRLGEPLPALITVTDLDGSVTSKRGTVRDFTWKGAYLRLWDAINGRRYPSTKNPWVWVVAFERAA